jgi:hypothetical protein
MPRFRFAVQNEHGRKQNGFLEAKDIETARRRLLQGGFSIISLGLEGQPPLAGSARSAPLWVWPCCLGLGCLALLLAVASWVRQPSPVPLPTPLKLTFSGRARAGEKVVLDLPELPIHQEFALKGSDYRFVVETKVEVRPNYAWVHLVDGSHRRPIPLQSEAVESSSCQRVKINAGKADYRLDELRF